MIDDDQHLARLTHFVRLRFPRATQGARSIQVARTAMLCCSHSTAGKRAIKNLLALFNESGPDGGFKWLCIAMHGGDMFAGA